MDRKIMAMTLWYSPLSQEHKLAAANLLKGITNTPGLKIYVTNRSHFVKVPYETKRAFDVTCRKPFLFFGGADRDRTDDLMTASHALSQLSYSPGW